MCKWSNINDKFFFGYLVSQRFLALIHVHESVQSFTQHLNDTFFSDKISNGKIILTVNLQTYKIKQFLQNKINKTN